MQIGIVLCYKRLPDKHERLYVIKGMLITNLKSLPVEYFDRRNKNQIVVKKAKLTQI